jgi:hypothetical protein
MMMMTMWVFFIKDMILAVPLVEYGDRFMNSMEILICGPGWKSVLVILINNMYVCLHCNDSVGDLVINKLSSFGFLKELGPRPSSSCQPVFLASSQ